MISCGILQFPQDSRGPVLGRGPAVEKHCIRGKNTFFGRVLCACEIRILLKEYILFKRVMMRKSTYIFLRL
jgi:hypothetical protein